MNKTLKIVLAVVAVIIIIAVIAVVTFTVTSNKEQSKLGEITSAEQLSELVTKVYSEVESGTLPMLDTIIVDITDEDAVRMYTGLNDGNDFEYLVISEPLINAQAYSFVLGKVKNGVSATNIAKTMSKNVDPNKWVCVSAEKVYATNSGDIVCLVMSNEETSKKVIDGFKKVAGKTGADYIISVETPELPDEMF